MVGAAAVLSGVTRMTVSLVVIMFELTGSVVFIVPLMAAVMASKWVGDAIIKKGIYDAHIELNGYPFLDSKFEFHYTTRAADCMRPRAARPTRVITSSGDSIIESSSHGSPLSEPLTVITANSMTVDDLDNLLKTSTHNGFPIVVSSASQYLIGFITRKDLARALHTAKATQEIYENTKVIFSLEESTSSASNGGPTSTVAGASDSGAFVDANKSGEMSDWDQVLVCDTETQRTSLDHDAASSSTASTATSRHRHRRQSIGPPPLNLRRYVDLAPVTVTDETPMENVIDMFRKLGLRQVLVIHNG